jgi:hypothetical protein
MDGLGDIPVSEEAKRQFEQLIRATAALDGVPDLDDSPARRVKHARHLLDMREARTVICQRLMTKYGIGRSQAYDAISQALKLSGFQ